MYNNVLLRGDNMNELDLFLSNINQNTDEDYKESISLYNLVNTFNKLLLSFKSEYTKLEKLELGKEINIIDFIKNDNNLRIIDMILYKPNMVNDSYTHLYLRELNGVSLPFITSDVNIHSDNGYYHEVIKIPAKLVKKYLDLFEKHELLFELYHYLKNNFIVNSESVNIHTRIDSVNNSLDKITGIKIEIDNYYLQQEDHIDIKFDLENNLKVDLSESSIRLNNKSIKTNENTYLDILKNLYISSRHLENEVNDKSKIKKLINNY